MSALAGPLAADGRRRVGILAARSVAAYAGFLAALRAGACAVPLAPDAPPDRLTAVAAAAGLDAVVVDASGAAGLATLLPLFGPDAILAADLPDPPLGARIRSARPARPGPRTRAAPGRPRRPDVHLGQHRRTQGRAHPAPQRQRLRPRGAGPPGLPTWRPVPARSADPFRCRLRPANSASTRSTCSRPPSGWSTWSAPPSIPPCSSSTRPWTPSPPTSSPSTASPQRPPRPPRWANSAPSNPSGPRRPSLSRPPAAGTSGCSAPNGPTRCAPPGPTAGSSPWSRAARSPRADPRRPAGPGGSHRPVAAAGRDGLDRAVLLDATWPAPAPYHRLWTLACAVVDSRRPGPHRLLALHGPGAPPTTAHSARCCARSTPRCRHCAAARWPSRTGRPTWRRCWPNWTTRRPNRRSAVTRAAPGAPAPARHPARTRRGPDPAGRLLPRRGSRADRSARRRLAGP
ncbi:hypothetical protein SHIRM173S_10197 [Streptomyces hirsutus]